MSDELKNPKILIPLVMVLVPVALGTLRCAGQGHSRENVTRVSDTSEGTENGATWMDWPQLYGNPEHDNFREQKNEIVCPKILWRVDFSPVPAVAGNDVYAGGQALRRIDLPTGEVKASFQPQDVSEQVNFKGTPVVLPDRVIAHGSNGRVYALTRDLRRVLWSQDVREIGWSSGVSNGDLFIVGTDRRLVAIDVRSGKIRWERAFSGKIEMTLRGKSFHRISCCWTISTRSNDRVDTISARGKPWNVSVCDAEGYGGAWGASVGA